MKTVNEKRSGDDVVLAAWQSQLAEAQDKPWLASLLLQQGERILRRFVYFYQQLRDLPRRTRRTIQKRLVTTLAGAALLLALSGTPSVHAANISVTPGAAGRADDGQCSLVEAIDNANSDSQLYATAGECTAGASADTITLAGNTYSYTVAFGSGGNTALPDISSEITIEANVATIQRTSGNFRILSVTSAGNLTLNNATITGGNALFDSGGGVLNNGGTVTINNSTVSANIASNYGGGIRNTAGGSLTLNNSTISGNQASEGAGINSDGTTLTINNSTIVGNTATARGGGIAVGNASATLIRSIVSGNTAATEANEIFNFFSTINGNNNNLFGYDGETNAQAFNSSFGNFTPGANDITATSDGGTPTALTSILNINLAQNGVNPHTFTHALVSGSPAIDVIPDDGINCDGEANTGTSRDQRGGVRANTTFGSGAACDIGAYEFGSTTPTAITIEGLGVHENGRTGLAVSSVAGILALLSGGILNRKLRRKSLRGD